MFNFDRDKTIWLLPSNSLDKSLHSLLCESSTVFSFCSQDASDRKPWTQREYLLMASGYLLGVLQHRVVPQGFEQPGSWNTIESNLWELKRPIWEITSAVLTLTLDIMCARLAHSRTWAPRQAPMKDPLLQVHPPQLMVSLTACSYCLAVRTPCSAAWNAPGKPTRKTSTTGGINGSCLTYSSH